MNVLFLGQLNEIGVKLCNSLAAAHEVIALADSQPDYRLDCRCVTNSGEQRRLLEGEVDLLVFLESGNEDINSVNALLSQTLEKTGCRLMYIKERPVFCRRPQSAAIGALLCREYASRYDTAVTLIEPSCLYGEETLPGFLRAALDEIRAHNTLTPGGAEDEYCDCLHIDDLCGVIRDFAERQDGGFCRYGLQSGYPFPLHRLIEKLKDSFRQITVEDYEETSGEAESESYRDSGWSPSHSFLEDLEPLLMLAGERDKKLSRLRGRKAMGNVAVAFSFAAVFALVEIYIQFITVSSDLQFVDMRLLFVVVCSLVLGKKYGVCAAVLCGAASVIQSLMIGYQWYVLFYHVDNWIPIAVYFAAAIGIGLYRDILTGKRGKKEI